MRKKVLIALGIPALVVAPAFFSSGALYAQTSAPNIPVNAPGYATFGMIGLAPGQTARVNALGLPLGGPIIANGACTVTITFLDDQGKSLATSTQPVSGGQAVHFDLPRVAIDSLVDRREIRATIRTSFVFPSTTPVPTIAEGQCAVKPTLEIFNEDGRTTAIIGGTTALPLVVPLVALP
jgi:hypothetical protein